MKSRKKYTSTQQQLLHLFQQDIWQEECNLTGEALTLLIEVTTKKYKNIDGADTKNIYLVQDDYEKLLEILSSINFSLDQHIKIIYIDRMRAVPCILSFYAGSINCFVVDSEHDSPIMNAIRAIYPHAKIFIANAAHGGSMLAYKSLLYFIKHAAEIFPFLYTHPLEKIPPELLKMLQDKVIFPEGRARYDHVEPDVIERIHAKYAHIKTTIRAAEYPELARWLEEAKQMLRNGKGEIYDRLYPFIFAALGDDKNIHGANKIDEAQNYTKKLLTVFVTSDAVIAYLMRFYKYNKGASQQFIHDACLFNLPENDAWDKNVWQKIVAIYTPSNPRDLILRYLAHAPRLEAEAWKENRAITAETTQATLSQHMKKITYTYAHVNPELAELYLTHNISDEDFTKYINLKPVDSQLIPYVKIKGGRISPEYKNYYLEKLSAFDGRNGILGNLTGCCQHLGGVAASSVIDAVTRPDHGVYALFKRKRNKSILIAQCWAWRVDDVIGFDSVEVQLDRRGKVVVSDMFMSLANQLVLHHGIKRVVVGEGGTSEKLRLLAVDPVLVPKSGYSDAKWRQYVLADMHIPVLSIYKENQKNSELMPPSLVIAFNKMEEEKLEQVLYLLAKNNLAEKFYFPYVDRQQPTFKRQLKLLKLSKEWWAEFKKDKNVRKNTTWLSNLSLYHSYLPDGFLKTIIDYLMNDCKSGSDHALLINLVKSGICLDLSPEERWCFIPAILGSISFAKYGKYLRLPLAGELIKNSKWEILQLYSDRRVPISPQTISTFSLLFMAEENCILLINNNATFETCNGAELNALFQLARKKYWTAFEMLVAKGYSPKARDKQGRTLLHDPNGSFKVENIAHLITVHGLDINAKDNHGDTLAHDYAVLEIDFPCFQWLYNHGAKIHEASKDGFTPLHVAASRNNVAAIELLLKHPDVDIETRDVKGKTALLVAAKEGHLESIKLLIAAGANMDVKTYQGKSIHDLIKKSAREHLFHGYISDAYKYFVECYGMNVNDPLPGAEKIFTTLLSFSRESCQKYLSDINWLLSKGATLSPKHDGSLLKCTALLHTNDFKPALKVMLERKLNLNAQDLFSVAANMCDIQFMDLILANYKIDINYAYSNQETALHRACFNDRFITVAKRLIELGINVNAADYKGRTALHIATDSHWGPCNEIIKVLVAAGGDVNCRDKDETFAVNSGLIHRI